VVHVGEAVLAVAEMARLRRAWDRMTEEELQVAEWNDHTSRRSGCGVGGEFFVYSCDSENYLYTNVVGHVNYVRRSN
jgi:hypothetical protein